MARPCSYDLLAIIPYLKQYGTDPASGEKITTKQLTRLHFHKNGDGKYHCPVTFKVCAVPLFECSG